MFKKIRKILAFFSLIDDKIDEIELLIYNFESSYEDGKLDTDEMLNLLLKLLSILKSLLLKLRK